MNEKLLVTWARRNKWLHALSLAPFALAALLLVATVLTGAPFAAIAPHLLIVGIFSQIYLRKRNPRPELVDGEASVEGGVLRFAGQEVPLSEIKRAVVVPSPTFPEVVIERRGLKPPVRLRMQSGRASWRNEEARQILRMVGFDATQRTLELTAMSQVMASPLRMFGTIFGGMGSAFALGALGQAIFPPLVMLAPIVLLLMAASFVMPSHVTVGGDGVLVQWLRWKRFVPIGDIGSAVVFDEGMGRNRRVGVLLSLPREELRIPVGSIWDLERAKALLERIDEVKATRNAKAIGDTAADGFLAQIERKAKSTKEWLDELRAIGTGALATHRIAPVAPETLLRVVEDPQAPKPARVAAAVALKSSGDEDAVRRVRVAAETAAHPKLRVALERSIEEDEAALIEAVDELTNEAP